MSHGDRSLLCRVSATNTRSPDADEALLTTTIIGEHRGRVCGQNCVRDANLAMVIKERLERIRHDPGLALPGSHRQLLSVQIRSYRPHSGGTSASGNSLEPEPARSTSSGRHPGSFPARPACRSSVCPDQVICLRTEAEPIRTEPQSQAGDEQGKSSDTGFQEHGDHLRANSRLTQYTKYPVTLARIQRYDHRRLNITEANIGIS